MGTSHLKQIPKILSIVTQIRPGSILDIGSGYGKYGLLYREYLNEDYLNTQDKAKRFLHMDSIEAFEKYVSPIHKFIFNNIFIGNALNIVYTLERSYDLITIVDVLEHFDKDNGIRMLEYLLKQGSTVLISTPKYVGYQEVEINEYEKHVSQWTTRNFMSLGYTYFIPDDISYIVIVSKDKKRINELKKNNTKSTMKEFLYKVPFLNKIYRNFFWKDKL